MPRLFLMNRVPPAFTLFPYTSLFRSWAEACAAAGAASPTPTTRAADLPQDRKSTRLNSSHGSISYAVFCLKKKKIGQPARVHLEVRRELEEQRPQPGADRARDVA